MEATRQDIRIKMTKKESNIIKFAASLSLIDATMTGFAKRILLEKALEMIKENKTTIEDLKKITNDHKNALAFLNSLDEYENTGDEK